MHKHNPDLTGLTFDEIEAQYGEEAAIDAGIAADPDTVEIDADWFAQARPTSEVISEVLPGLRARYARSFDQEANHERGVGADGVTRFPGGPVRPRPPITGRFR